MRKICIFEKDRDKLFAACFEDFTASQAEHILIDDQRAEETIQPPVKDELDKALDFWSDAKSVRAFFNQYRRDLIIFEPTLKVDGAVLQAMSEAENLVDRLKEACESNLLDKLFKPLDNRESGIPLYDFQKLKAKGSLRKSMVRLYAVKFADWYVVTGGTLKITEKMQGRPHLQAALNKLELTQKYLQKTSNVETSFVYL